jgi:hypothetical protein
MFTHLSGNLGVDALLTVSCANLLLNLGAHLLCGLRPGSLGGEVAFCTDQSCPRGIPSQSKNELRDEVPLFTHLPRGVLPGNQTSGIGDSRELSGHEKRAGLLSRGSGFMVS